MNYRYFDVEAKHVIDFRRTVLIVDDELKKIPVTVLTADIEAEVESLQRGAVDFISKPFGKPEAIRARVKRAIELYIDKDLINNAGTALYSL